MVATGRGIGAGFSRVLVLGVALLLVACSTTTAPPDAPAADVPTVTIRSNAPFNSFDPIIPAGGAQQQVNAAAYDTLMSLSADGKLVGNLAESWTATPTSVKIGRAHV